MAKTTRRTEKRHAATKTDRSARWTAQREHLLQAAQRAIHREGQRISMDDIAAEAGITKPILYRHFGDRRGLACALRNSAFGLNLGLDLAAATETHEAARRAARDRVAALYPIVQNTDELRRLIVGFATGFRMFVELNRNLYRFLRAEGVLESMWAEIDPSGAEPVAESLSGSLESIYRSRGIDPVMARVWAHAIRGMVGGVVDWWTEEHACDRFELERQFDMLTRAMIGGLEQALKTRNARSKRPAPRRARPAPREAPRERKKHGDASRRRS
ncbi:MAG: TetR/AcrR family transcriptional regulator [Deltaproteobacteria bacterium]|nr:TetR/AcrR family transcriptional regulator [Deltaproteobacteria bacterium]